jgi:hypothetical protein
MWTTLESCYSAYHTRTNNSFPPQLTIALRTSQDSLDFSNIQVMAFETTGYFIIEFYAKFL